MGTAIKFILISALIFFGAVALVTGLCYSRHGN